MRASGTRHAFLNIIIISFLINFIVAGWYNEFLKLHAVKATIPYSNIKLSPSQYLQRQ